MRICFTLSFKSRLEIFLIHQNIYLPILLCKRLLFGIILLGKLKTIRFCNCPIRIPSLCVFEENIRFSFSIRIPWFWKKKSNRTISHQEKIRIPCRPSKTNLIIWDNLNFDYELDFYFCESLMDGDNNFALWQRLQKTSQLQKFHHQKLQGSAPTPEQNQWWFL